MKRREIKKKRRALPLLAGVLFFAAGTALAGPDVSLNVRSGTERDENRTETSRDNALGDEVTTTTDTETETCTLEVSVKLRDQAALECQLEWYFISDHIKNIDDKGTLQIFSPGKKTIALEENVELEETIVSEPFVMTRVQQDGDVRDKQSGDEYKGYIVLVRKDGEILDQKSNSARFLKEEWIQKCKQAK
jgi:hypothetical protein